MNQYNDIINEMASLSFFAGEEIMKFYPNKIVSEKKDDFFEERLSPDLKLSSPDVLINKDDHYPPMNQDNNVVSVQDIPAPRQIFSSGGSNCLLYTSPSPRDRG